MHYSYTDILLLLQESTTTTVPGSFPPSYTTQDMKNALGKRGRKRTPYSSQASAPYVLEKPPIGAIEITR